MLVAGEIWHFLLKDRSRIDVESTVSRFSVRASFVVFPCVYTASYGFVPQIALLGSRLDW